MKIYALSLNSREQEMTNYDTNGPQPTRGKSTLYPVSLETLAEIYEHNTCIQNKLEIDSKHYL